MSAGWASNAIASTPPAPSGKGLNPNAWNWGLLEYDSCGIALTMYVAISTSGSGSGSGGGGGGVGAGAGAGAGAGVVPPESPPQDAISKAAANTARNDRSVCETSVFTGVPPDGDAQAQPRIPGRVAIRKQS